MKNLFLMLMVLCLCMACNKKPLQQEPVQVAPTSFILLRHAEKAKDDPRDPSLNEQGKKRALAIAQMFGRTTPTALYATPYKRTQNTLAPLAEQLNQEILTYDRNNKNMIEEILEQNKGGLVFISGHSNTTPALVNKLIGSDEYKNLSEDDYGTMFWVTVSSIGDGTVQVINY